MLDDPGGESSLCPYCHGDFKFKKKYKVVSKITGKRVNYYPCRKCGSFVQYPYPDPATIKNYYESYYEIKQKINNGYLKKDRYDSLKKERDQTFEELGFSKEQIASGVNLEFGCANGLFLRYLKENGSQTTIGIDISDQLLSSIDLSDVLLLNQPLSEVKSDFVDHFYLFHVLEHLRDPEEFLGHLVRVCRKEANILLEVPICGWVSFFFGKHWRFLIPDEHLNIPSMRGLRCLLERHGLAVVKMTRFGSGLTSGEAPAWIKKRLDFFIKKVRVGDRAAFLIAKNKD